MTAKRLFFVLVFLTGLTVLAIIGVAVGGDVLLQKQYLFRPKSNLPAWKLKKLPLNKPKKTSLNTPLLTK